MVRNYKRKTDPIDPDKLARAVHAVLKEGWSVLKAAKEFSLAHMTLRRYCQSAESLEEATNSTSLTPSTSTQIVLKYTGHATVFSKEQELALMAYLLRCSDLYFGLASKDVRQLAFQYAKKLKIAVPNWEEEETAGIEWFRLFMKRHPTLAIRKPEATSLQRATAFNRSNVSNFFNNLKSLYERHHFDASKIWNTDETGITTVQNPNRVISRKGQKQVGRITSSERGTLVTMALAISATGNATPPFFVFPRVQFKPHFLNGGPQSCAGAANQSGWMNAENFLKFLKHFQKHSGSTNENPVLLILDNHESHVSIDNLKFCIDNGIVVLSLPPHCSHRLQPLDRTVFGPFKKAINYFSDAWINANPGRSMSIYDIPGIASSAIDVGVTRNNIISGFRSTGIWPMNEYIFDDTDFMPSKVTDQPASAHPDVHPVEEDSSMPSRDKQGPSEEALSNEVKETSGPTRISTSAIVQAMKMKLTLKRLSN